MAATWTAIALLGTALAVLIGAFFQLGARIDALGRDLRESIEAQGRDLAARIEAVDRSLGARIDAQTARIDAQSARIDAHLEWHTQ
jgi:hypothetical protein